MTTKTAIIGKYLPEGVEELQHQADQWAEGDIQKLGEVDLKHNGPMDWVGFIAHYSTRWFPGGFPPYSRATLLEFRKSMVKVLTLAVSALRWVDAKLEDPELQ